MKKTTLFLTAILFLTFGNAFAEGIKFSDKKTWKGILAEARIAKKIIFLDAYATWCGPCRYMQNEVFTNQAVGEYFNANFINVKMDMEKGEGPALSDQLGVTAYPTLFFIDATGKVLHKYVGALNAEELISLGKSGKDPKSQFYTTKAKAEAGTLNPEEFHSWVHAAEKLRDENTEEIVKKYIAANQDWVKDKELLKVVTDHATELTQNQLNYLVKQKPEIIKMLNWTDAKLSSVLTEKVVTYALNETFKEGKIDFNQFKTLVSKFAPEKAALETQKVKVKYYFISEENAKGLDELGKLITTGSFKLPAEELASLIIKYSDKIVESDKAKEFITKIEQFKLQPLESTQGYFKDFALLAIYHTMEETQKVAALKTKIKKYQDLPADVQEIVANL